MKHYKITISGKVQGVLYRKHAEMKANQLGVKGHIINQHDGAVYIEAEAEEKKLDEFVRWCYVGSPHSQVKRVKYEQGDLQNYSDFKIIH